MNDCDAIRTASWSREIVEGQKDVLERIVAGDPLPVVLECLVETIERRSGDGVMGSVLLLDADGIHLRHGAAPRLPAEYVAAIDGVAIGPSVGSCGTAAYRRERVIVEDIAVDPLWSDFREVALAAGLRACWSTPVVAGDGELLGTFAMYYPAPRRPSGEDLSLIELMSRTAGVAIARCRADAARDRALRDARRANAELERAHAELNFVLEVATQVASTLEGEETLTTLARLAVPALADVCLIDIVEDGVIRRAAAAADGAARRDLATRLVDYAPDPSGSHPAVRVLRSGRPQLSAEMTADFLRQTARDEEHFAMLRDLGFESYMSVPLAARGRVFGALTLVSAGSGRRYGERDLALAGDLARRVALAIDNIHLYQTARDAERRLALVARAGVALTSSLDLAAVIEHVGRLLVPEVGDACEVHVRRWGREWHRATFVLGEDRQGELVAVAAVPPTVARALADRRPVTTVGERAGVFGSGRAAAEAGSALVVPLFARGETIGALAVAAADSSSGARVPPDVVEVLAGRVALAIDNATLYDEQRSAADILQRSLLPQRLPDIPGMRFAAAYRPAGTEVGGDWYDVVALPDGRVGIAMGDVMGRGVRAASVMGQLRNGVRALAARGDEPAAVLGVINRVLADDEDPPLATLAYGVIDPAAGSWTVANAGHCPPLVTRRGVTAFLDQPPDPPLGVALDTRYRQVRHPLTPGDGLVLYTDGLVETPKRPLGDGLAALAGAVAGLGHLDPAAIRDHLLGILHAGDADDDTAVLVVRLDAAD